MDQIESRTRWPWWLGALSLVALTLLLLGYTLNIERAMTGGVIGAPLDDAWIHFQFARNISRGDGFSYNPGQPTPGSTAPLWTLILAGGALLSPDLLRLSLALSAVFLISTVLLAYGFAGWVTGRWWPALLAGLGVAASGRLLWAGLAGMETTAFAALSLAAIWSYSRRGLGLGPSLLFALAAQLRPEGHALFALAVGDAIWSWLRIDRKSRAEGLAGMVRAFVPPLALYLLIALPYSLFSLSITGRPLPNTFYAKVGSASFFSWRTLRETLALHWGDNPVALILAVPGLWPLWRRSRLAVLWLLALPLLTALIIDFTWHHGRYTMPLIPLVQVAAAAGASWLVDRLAPRVGEQFPWRFGAPLVVLFLLLLAGVRQVPTWAAMLGANTREIEEIDVALGRWLADNTPPEALIAVDDIGAIAYLSERRIFDMNGLVSPEVWPAVAATEGLERDQLLTRILSEVEPDLMAAFPLWRWNIASNPDVAQPLHHVRTESHTIIFQQDAYVYEMTWPYISGAAPEITETAVFGAAIRLLGYEWRPQGPVLYWESLATVPVDYDVFIHVLDDQGQIVAQSDRQPLSGLAATSTWLPGDQVRDPHTVLLPESLAPGAYEVRLGLYDRQNGQRLPISGVSSSENALSLGTISLP